LVIEKVLDLRIRCVEARPDPDQALHASRLSRRLGRFLIWHQPRNRLARFADDDLFPGGYPLHQFRKVGLGFVNVRHTINLNLV